MLFTGLTRVVGTDDPADVDGIDGGGSTPPAPAGFATRSGRIAS
jgi:hypothetical protein